MRLVTRGRGPAPPPARGTGRDRAPLRARRGDELRGRRRPAAVQPRRRRGPPLRGRARDRAPAEHPVLRRVDRVPSPDGRPVRTGRRPRRVAPTRLPDVDRGLIDEDQFVVDSTRFRLADPPRFTTFVTLRQQDGLDDTSELVDGRWPDRARSRTRCRSRRAATVRDRRVRCDGRGHPGRGRRQPRRQRRPGRSAPAEHVPAPVDRGRDRGRRARSRCRTRPLRSGSTTGASPRSPSAAPTTTPIAFATAVFAPEAYADVLALDLPLRYQWRSFVDPDRLDAGSLDVLAEDLRRLDAAFGTTGAAAPGVDPVPLRAARHRRALSRPSGRRARPPCRSPRSAR